MRTEDLHHETKFVLPAARASLVSSLLARSCQPDREHPESEVVSLYFDTPDLASYRQKRASEYLKTKWRVRWYRVGGATVEPAFVERKDRVGTRRRKRRALSPMTAAELDRAALAAVRPLELLAPLRDAGEDAPAALLPCLRLEYRRRRFLDRATDTRLCLDVEIRATAVHPRFRATRDRRPLAVAVLELKGDLSRLPALLPALLAAGCRRAAFSKYAAAIEHQGLAPQLVA